MENKFPKNVRQIGNVSDTPKIYVEDYVDTFLNQICDKADNKQVGAFLVHQTTWLSKVNIFRILTNLCDLYHADLHIVVKSGNDGSDD